MNGPSLAESIRRARAALSGGPEVTLGVVVAAPDRPGLVGRRLVWDGERLHGDLDEPGLAAVAERVLRSADRDPGCRALDETGVEIFVERIGPPPELVIVGAGHIARPLCSVGALLGWRVTVLDDRPEFARAERFPDAARVLVADFDAPFADVEIGPSTRLVLVTRGHRYDYDCLKALAAADAAPAYLGMIGSRRRVRAAFEQLAAEGFDAAWLEKVYAPIGLDVGSETPAEIAVAIAAEMVLAERGGTGRPLREVKQVVRYVKALGQEVG
ncbi:MAG: XdhC family protein [Gemmatimonadota bacterium]|nr:XdhC family protein [Gemmatimonadota bacterium]